MLKGVNTFQCRNKFYFCMRPIAIFFIKKKIEILKIVLNMNQTSF